MTALNVLEYIDDDRKALTEIYRILKSGGLAHIEVPADPASFDLYDEVLLHFRRYRLSELIAKASAIGFVVRKPRISASLLIRSLSTPKNEISDSDRS